MRINAKLSELRAVLTDALIQPLLTIFEAKMSQVVDALKAAADAETANSAELKRLLNVATAANTAQAATIVTLTAERDAALANAADPADAAAIQAVTQQLADSTAVNSPAN